MACPDCDIGFFMVMGEQKIKVTVNNPELEKKIQEVVDRNVTCKLCYCLTCFKPFVDVEANTEKMEAEIKEMAEERVNQCLK